MHDHPLTYRPQPRSLDRERYGLLRRSVVALALLSGLGFVTSAEAQSPYDYTVAVSLGLGGFMDATPDTGVDDQVVQGLFKMRLEPHTYFGVRVGQLELTVDEDRGGAAFDASLLYATVAGEYTFNDGWYESGLFLGLGAYDLAGDFAIADETGLGLTAGVNGDFRLTRRLSMLVELSGHWADLEHAQTFVTGSVGLALHF